MVEALRNEYSLFHWHLEFPEIFNRGGFDLVLGNPPWDTLSPDVKEFFSTFDPQVREQDRDGQRAIVEHLLETPQIARRLARQLPPAVLLRPRVQERRPLPPVRCRQPRQGRLQHLPDVR